MFAPAPKAAVIAAGSLRSTASKWARSDSGVDGGKALVGGTAAVVVTDDEVVGATEVSDELQPANAPVTETAKIAQARTDLRGRAVTADHFLGQEFQASS
ncbi:hypothetical protein GCM10020255_034410 [Rhodococcus baikonurensis]